jgi:hypothetical protein
VNDDHPLPEWLSDTISSLESYHPLKTLVNGAIKPFETCDFEEKARETQSITNVFEDEYSHGCPALHESLFDPGSAFSPRAADTISSARSRDSTEDISATMPMKNLWTVRRERARAPTISNISDVPSLHSAFYGISSDRRIFSPVVMDSTVAKDSPLSQHYNTKHDNEHNVHIKTSCDVNGVDSLQGSVALFALSCSASDPSNVYIAASASVIPSLGEEPPETIVTQPNSIPQDVAKDIDPYPSSDRFLRTSADNIDSYTHDYGIRHCKDYEAFFSTPDSSVLFPLPKPLERPALIGNERSFPFGSPPLAFSTPARTSYIPRASASPLSYPVDSPLSVVCHPSFNLTTSPTTDNEIHLNISEIDFHWYPFMRNDFQVIPDNNKIMTSSLDQRFSKPENTNPILPRDDSLLSPNTLYPDHRLTHSLREPLENTMKENDNSNEHVVLDPFFYSRHRRAQMPKPSSFHTKVDKNTLSTSPISYVSQVPCAQESSTSDGSFEIHRDAHIHSPVPRLWTSSVALAPSPRQLLSPFENKMNEHKSTNVLDY